MQLTQALEDQEIRRLLQGDENDLELAFTQVDAQLRRRFVKGARDRLPGLPPEDLADAWQGTLKALLQAVRSGRFQANRELIPWLWTIFLRKAVDGLRRSKRLASLAIRARARAGGVAAAGVDPEEREAVLARIREAVDALPLRQRTVLRVFLDQYPATRDCRVLQEQVSTVSGREETAGSVRRALEEARRRISKAFRMELL